MKAITTGTIRYRVQDTSGQVLSVYGQKRNAIKRTIKFAIEFPGTQFIVMRKTVKTEKIVFKFIFDAEFSFSDIKDVYAGFVSAFSEKEMKTKVWFKS